MCSGEVDDVDTPQGMKQGKKIVGASFPCRSRVSCCSSTLPIWTRAVIAAPAALYMQEQR